MYMPPCLIFLTELRYKTVLGAELVHGPVLSTGPGDGSALFRALRQFVSHSFAHFDRIVVAGSAITIPSNPKRVPHIDKESRIIAGFNPMALPMILGVRTKSEKHSTKAYTARHSIQIVQKSIPVSIDLNAHITVTGIREI